MKAEAPARIGPGRTGVVTLELVLPGPRLWGPDSPALYEAKVRLFERAHETDSLSDRFGVRSIEARGRQILLNGQALRIRADLEAVKAAGANLVRVHFPPTPTTLRIADELGLLYMEEVPLNWWRAAWNHPFRPSS